MFYYVTITRNGQTLYVVSPRGGVFELSETKEKCTYLWTAEQSAKDDPVWQHLIQEGDEIKYIRTYSY